MNDTLRIILTLMVNRALPDMQDVVANFLNGEDDFALENAEGELAQLLEHVREHIDYRDDMNFRRDNEQFMQYTDSLDEEAEATDQDELLHPVPYGSPPNDIIESFDFS